MLASAAWLHRLIQQRVSPRWALLRGAAVPAAVSDLVVNGGDPSAVWLDHGAPPGDLPEASNRHLPEVHRLLELVWRAGMVSGAVGTALSARNSSTVMRRSGLISLLTGGIGVLASLVIFQPTWDLYHRMAYANRDWQLPDDVLLAALYPERFYQRLAVVWFGGVAMAGAAFLVAGGRQRRPSRGAG
ncbi:MAG: hypothetical protein IT337_15405 [Thermomicrobiales bacterium]|nr:hypothetical protein [Thermomicrobiales bacterium]